MRVQGWLAAQVPVPAPRSSARLRTARVPEALSAASPVRVRPTVSSAGWPRAAVRRLSSVRPARSARLRSSLGFRCLPPVGWERSAVPAPSPPRSPGRSLRPTAERSPRHQSRAAPAPPWARAPAQRAPAAASGSAGSEPARSVASRQEAAAQPSRDEAPQPAARQQEPRRQEPPRPAARRQEPPRPAARRQEPPHQEPRPAAPRPARTSRRPAGHRDTAAPPGRTRAPGRAPRARTGAPVRSCAAPRAGSPTRVPRAPGRRPARASPGRARRA